MIDLKCKDSDLGLGDESSAFYTNKILVHVSIANLSFLT